MQATRQITVLGDEAVEVSGHVDDGRVLVSAGDVHRATGWELKPEGLCRGDVCTPIHDRSTVELGEAVDLIGVADALGCPSLVDDDVSMVALGRPQAERHRALVDRVVPDLELIDVAGAMQSTASWEGRKTLLVAFSTW